MLINKPRLNLRYANRGLDLKTLAVHDKKFHADDVLAAMLLRAIYPNIKIVRTRDQNKVEECDVAVDVGGSYDFENLKFDHHQEDKAGKRANGIEYSGVGLVWKHWGIEICKGKVDLFEFIDSKIIQPVDAQDNGQSLHTNLVFGVNDFNLDNINSMALNPSLTEKGMDDGLFEEAMDLFEYIFGRILKRQFEAFELKEQILKEYSKLEDSRFLIHEEFKPVLKFSSEMPNLLFYLYKDGNDKRWVIRTIPGKSEFTYRKNLPAKWAGKEGSALEKASGIKGMTFCHNTLFICGAKNKEAILKALRLALEN